jgi:hypothetical protein
MNGHKNSSGWALDYINRALGNNINEYVWDTVANSFYQAFTNITKEVDVQTDIKQLKMKGDQGLGDYTTTFE